MEVASLVTGLYLKIAHVEETDFFNAGANSGKLKAASMILGWTMSKNGHGLLVHETVKSAKL